jgi:hypothetical protein
LTIGTDDPVLDPIDDLGDQLDPTTCALLVPLSTTLGVVEITPEGDVFVSGEQVLDCPPYGLDGSGPEVARTRVVLAGFVG